MGTIGWILLVWLTLNVAVPLGLVALPRVRRLVRNRPAAPDFDRQVASGSTSSWFASR